MIIASISSAVGAISMAALFIAVFIAGGWVWPELARAFGLSRFAPSLEQSAGYQVPPNERPKAQKSQREKVVDAIKDEAGKEAPFDPVERIKAAKRKIVLITVGAVLYVLSPVDAAPALLLGPFGTIDDILVIYGAYRAANNEWKEALAAVEAFKLTHRKAS